MKRSPCRILLRLFRALPVILTMGSGCTNDSRVALHAVRADWMSERYAHDFALVKTNKNVVSQEDEGSNTQLKNEESATPPTSKNGEIKPSAPTRHGNAIISTRRREKGLFSLHDGDRPWHIDFGFRTSHTKLAETRQMLSDRLDKPMATDVFGLFESPYSPVDRKSDGRLNALYLGIGRSENDWLAWSVYFVGGAITDNQSQKRSLLRLNTTFEYGNYLLGLKTELYPWGRPELLPTPTWQERLENTKPFFYTGVETGYVSGAGRGRYEIATIPVCRDEVVIRDWTVGFPVGLGLWLPLDDRWSFILSADYSWHVYRRNEYSGWNLNAGIRYMLQ